MLAPTGLFANARSWRAAVFFTVPRVRGRRAPGPGARARRRSSTSSAPSASTPNARPVRKSGPPAKPSLRPSGRCSSRRTRGAAGERSRADYRRRVPRRGDDQYRSDRRAAPGAGCRDGRGDCRRRGAAGTVRTAGRDRAISAVTTTTRRRRRPRIPLSVFVTFAIFVSAVQRLVGDLDRLPDPPERGFVLIRLRLRRDADDVEQAPVAQLRRRQRDVFALAGHFRDVAERRRQSLGGRRWSRVGRSPRRAAPDSTARSSGAAAACRAAGCRCRPAPRRSARRA